MKKTKKIVTLCVALCLITLWVIRVVYINVTFDGIKEKVYSMDQTVEYEEDFYETMIDFDYRKGYSIKVNSATLYTIEQYIEEHDIRDGDLKLVYNYYSAPDPEDVYIPEFVYDIEVTITADQSITQSRSGESAAGISLWDTMAISTNSRLTVSTPIFGLVYPDIGDVLGFAVRPGTSMTLHFPLVADVLIANNGTDYTYDYLTNEDFFLLLSQYPTKKMIKLELTENKVI